MLGDHLASGRRENLVTDLLVLTFVGLAVAFLSGRSSGTGSTSAEQCQHGFGLAGLAFLNLDLAQGAICRSHDFQHDLVSLDLDDQLIALTGVTDLLVPSGDSAFRDGFREARRLDFQRLAFATGGRFALGLGVVLAFSGRLLLLVGRCGICVTDGTQYLLGLAGLAFLDLDLAQGAVLRCHHFQHHLVSLDLDDQLVALDAASGLLVQVATVPSATDSGKDGALISIAIGVP